MRREAHPAPPFVIEPRRMKYTLAITQECNLACTYCYIGKKPVTMSLGTAAKIVDFMYRVSPPGELIDVGFFGGEPLLELDLIGGIVDLVKSHVDFPERKVLFSTVSNGTLFSDDVAHELTRLGVTLGISCDGYPEIQDRSRVFPDGRGSSGAVEVAIRRALHFFPFMPVNAVYRPETLAALPEVVEYLVKTGVRNLYLNLDITATWSEADSLLLPDIYDRIGKQYISYYQAGVPVHISLIDSKIVAILRGGYKPEEKCRMGKAEFAFAPSGDVYPCERLMGAGEAGAHCLGNINDEHPLLGRCLHDAETSGHEVCRTCSLLPYCMCWCGCTNYFSTGDYSLPGAFLCASERAAIGTAYHVLEILGREGFSFSDHLAGSPLMSIFEECCTTSPGRK